MTHLLDAARHGRRIRVAPLVALVLAAIVATACGAEPPASLGAPGSGAPATGGTAPATAVAVGTTGVPGASGGASGDGSGSPGSGSAVPTGTAAAGSASGSPGAATASAASASTAASRPLPVPGDLRPSLADAGQDIPIIYRDGCHLGVTAVSLPPCAFGDLASRTTVVLVGDSKAAQWFPALLQLATERHWRLISLTKSACTAADVPVWNSTFGGPNTSCDTWRQNVVKRVAMEHPALVIVSDDRLYQLAVNGAPVPLAKRPDLWNAGLARMLTSLRANAADVVLLGDTPRSRFDPPKCLASHMADARPCSTPLKQAADASRLAADHVVADASGARFVDPTTWVCPSDPCPPIIGNLLVNREQDHLTSAFVDSLAPRLGTALGLP